MSEMEQLKQRIAALEAKLGKSGKAEEKDEKDEKSTLASEIASLERQLNAEEDEDDEKKATDDADKDDEKKAEDKDEKDDKSEKKASEVDPNGIEEQITQDRFTEVERLEHGTELATGPSMGAVAPTRSEYVARMKAASVRLDKVAAYLEKHGRRELAFRVDKIADAIDAKIKQEGK